MGVSGAPLFIEVATFVKGTWSDWKFLPRLQQSTLKFSVILAFKS